MISILTNLFVFATGAAIGSVVTWKIIESKYQQIAREEIESVREMYAEKKGGSDEESKDSEAVTTEVVREKPALDEYAARIAEQNYASDEKGGLKSVGDKFDTPHAIPPEYFGEEDDYETISLTYYADDVLADDADEIIDDVDEIVGSDFAEYFGVYEEDTVFIRNDERKTDYEICRDQRNYSDVAYIGLDAVDDE